MANSTIFDDAVYTTIVHTAGVTSGVPILVGSALYFPQSTETAGNPVSCMVRGCVSYTKVGAQAWVAGDPIFWNGSAFTNVQTGVLKAVGQANRIAANPSTTGYVDLGVGVEADSDMGTFKADLASTTDAAKGTALVGYQPAGSTLATHLGFVPTQTAAAGAAQEVLVSAGANRTQKALSGVTAVTATAGTGAQLALAEPTGSGASKVILEAPALAADATLTLPIASRDFADIPSMAAAGAVGGLIGTPAADKALASTLLNYTYASNVAADVGKAVVECFQIKTGAASGLFKDAFNANFPYMAMIVGAHFLSEVTAAGETVQLRDAVSGGGAAITDTMPAAAANEVSYCGEIAWSKRIIQAGTSLSLLKSNAAVAGAFFLFVIRVQ